MRKALVYKSTGSWYKLRDLEDNSIWKGRVRGKLKIDTDISSSNPVSVGDVVYYEQEDELEETGIIKDVQQRENYIVRVSPQNRNQKHIIAANLDAALLIATLSEPRTSTGFIDRFMLTAEAYQVPVVLVINKGDLLQEEQNLQLETWRDLYENAGYHFFVVSAFEEASLLPLQIFLKDKTTLFSGHSGVGKSTLINALVPELTLRTGEISEWSGKGQHTTTFAEMVDLPTGGRIIDTPGVKEFGIVDMKREELAQYFPEMRRLLSSCRFHNCMHLNEPGCAVKREIALGNFPQSRYESYLSILDNMGSYR